MGRMSGESSLPRHCYGQMLHGRIGVLEENPVCLGAAAVGVGTLSLSLYTNLGFNGRGGPGNLQ